MIHVIHDYLMVRGGAERLALTLASGLSAPLITGFRTRDVTDWGDNAEIHPLGSVIDGRLMKYLATAARFNNIAPALLSQEANIYSGVLAPFAAKRQTMGRRIHYCHSPPRFLYDLKNFYCDQMSFVRRRGMSLFEAWYKPGYEAALRAMDLVIANSQNVARRLKLYLDIDSMVIPPPIDTDRFRWIEPGDYFVSLARLEDYKRIDLIIEAFRRMPDRKLVVASGGSKSNELRALAAGSANICFTSWLDDAQLADLVGRCRAAIYVPQDEDFGMSPLEAMAAGKAVIGVKEGGLMETVIDGETGTLLDPHPKIENIVNAVEYFTAERALAMRRACEGQASRFSRSIFLERMRQAIANGKTN